MAAAGCAVPGAMPGADGSGAALTASDWRWLNRVNFRADEADARQLQTLGRKACLDRQLAPPAQDPPALADAIAAMPVAQQSAEQRLRAARAEQRRIHTLTDEDERQAARAALNRANSEAVQDTTRRHLLRALRSPAQLREQMTWFWMNHFNVYAGKGNVRWTLGEYEERSVRPHALGRFDTLAMATLRSPAMLEYLDNAQSAANRINENYARELMELHTLGVAGGPSGSRYTQQDVQELARVLTGVGIDNDGQPPRLAPQRQALYLHEGLFEFNPARHDFGAKTVLGQRIEGRGFGEVEQAVELLSRQPATARFVSHKLAAYFVADTPPPALVDRMAQRFERSRGDIAEVLRTMFLSPEMEAALAPGGPQKFKDPFQYVVSSLRLAYAERPIGNLRPVIGWLNQLGEPLYGRVSPDGYPASEAAWASSGQMVKRFEIARAIGAGQAALYADDDDDGKPLPRTGFPVLATRTYYRFVEPTLGPATRSALAQAASQPEWNAVLLSSPEWMTR
ncbi:DUF1800 domain-containing protein [Xylophilus ampelinus]|nr:DUF1800 domain-containing protein [Xylophilus ampelinus]MCS4508953.1 DUF1800 domain-containing protein [Xylophilus ampelinus]